MSVDRSPLDLWTVVHFAGGVFAGYLKIPLYIAVLLAVLWEVIENRNYPERTIPGFSPESPVNAFVDVVAFVLGYGVGWYGREQIRSLAAA